MKSKIYIVIVLVFAINAGFLYQIDQNENTLAKYTYQGHDAMELDKIFGNSAGYVTYADTIIAGKNIHSLYRYMALTDICITAAIAAAIYSKKNKASTKM